MIEHLMYLGLLDCDNTLNVKGIVHFEIKCWYVLDYLKGIQDVQ